MNKKVIIGVLIGVAVILVLVLISSGSPKSAEFTEDNQSKASDQVLSSKLQAAEKIEVVHFHATQQCWSCTTVGEYALKTIKNRFPEEYQNGTIIFKDINGELPENRDMVTKYQATGSSLFVNAITAGNDRIEEDVTVWRLVSDEQKFLAYFEARLTKLLGE